MNSRILIEVHVTLEEFNSHLNCWILRLATRILIKTLKNFERILWENSDKIKDEFLNNSELLDNNMIDESIISVALLRLEVFYESLDICGLSLGTTDSYL